MQIKSLNKSQKGITLLTLVITIIVLLILAGVSLSALFGDSGLLNNAENAKLNTEIAGEKESISIAAVSVLAKNGEIEKTKLNEELETKFGEGNTKTYSYGDGYVVKLEDKNRAYEVDENGNVKQVSMDIFNVDDTPGVLEGKGTTSEPLIIMSIEDLVAMARGDFNFNKKYVKLGRDLDFKSELSYVNYETHDYNEFLGVTDDVGLLEALTNEKYNGFKTITFQGGNVNSTFLDGDNKVIKNMYMKGEGTLGFLKMNAATNVKNLEITGKIISTGDNVGGISAQYGIIENCISRVDITSTGNNVGGIVGHNATVRNCKNYGKITGAKYVGGIAGYIAAIYNSENYGNVRASVYAGRNRGIGMAWRD